MGGGEGLRVRLPLEKAFFNVNICFGAVLVRLNVNYGKLVSTKLINESFTFGQQFTLPSVFSNLSLALFCSIFNRFQY
jgi:hypothetical protein